MGPSFVIIIWFYSDFHFSPRRNSAKCAIWRNCGFLVEFFSLLSSFSSSCSPGIIYNINKQLRRRRSFDEFLFLQFINSQKSPMAIHQISRQLPQNGTKSNNWQMCYSCYKDVPWSKRISTDLPQRLEWWYVTIASIGQWWTTIKNSKTNKITLVPGNPNFKYLIPTSFFRAFSNLFQTPEPSSTFCHPF